MYTWSNIILYFNKRKFEIDMKKLTALALFIGFMIPTFAQFGALKRAKQKLQQKVEDKLERRAEREVDRKIDKEIDDLFSSDKKSESNQSENADGAYKEDEVPQMDLSKIKAMYGGKEDIASSYNFDLQVKWKMQVDDKEEMIMEQMMANDGSAISMTTKGYTNIQDFENNMSITFMDGNQIMIMDLDKMMELAEDYADKDDDGVVDGSFEFTGKTKTILGYPCEQIIYKGENVEHSETWFTKNLKGLSGTYYKNYFRSNPELTEQYKNLSGMPLLTITKTSEGETVRMEAIAVKKEKTTYNIDNYKVMNMGF